ncbi:MAG: DUF2318 domain-containing protein [Proteobacteria bacterium]|nr:DUF2318 domain-containing protein [Desulfobacula sp.]MBU3952757.1 DUF2318 domain-containing protein [Pseudomonadota bacterium]MBU4130593.1 DUF2318 domain-containing protein [Pseudomonadota bacterium]
MKQIFFLTLIALILAGSTAHAWFGGKFTPLTPENNQVSIPLEKISDGQAHYFTVKSEKGVMVEFFVVKSQDGVVRAAVDACDVCYRAGKGYVQEGDVMVCTNCGMRFATDRINEVKGGCNPAPLTRVIDGGNLVISMADINANAWLCAFKK